MDRGRAVAADRRGGDTGVAAVRHRHRLAAGAEGFLGQGAARRRGASAAGAATGGDRLSAADHIRAQGSGRLFPRRFRHRVLVPLDRRGARLRRDGVSAAGARDPAVVRGDRPPARGRRVDARRQPNVGVPHRDLAARVAWCHRRHGAGVRQGARRVRRHHHVRLQHPR